MLSQVRIAIANVCKELNHDDLLAYDKLGTKDGMLVFLKRLAAKKDGAGARMTPTLAVAEADEERGRGGRGRGRGRGNGRGGRGGRGNRDRRLKVNPRGMSCHECNSTLLQIVHKYHHSNDLQRSC